MNLNEYFKRIKKYKNCIIVISGKDESAKYINNFVMKGNLHLNCKIGNRDSYVALIDFRREFVYEKNSQQRIACSYQVDEKFIDIISEGYNCGNKSSIKVGFNEYSLNRRGVNIAIFNAKTLKLVDKFAVDSHGDETLTLIKK